MKRTIAILLTVIYLTVTCCGCGSHKDEKTETVTSPTVSDESYISQNESTDDKIDESYISQNESTDDKITVEDVKKQLSNSLESLGHTSGFTNEKTETNTESTTHSFSFFLGKVSVSIIETDAEVQQIMCYAFPSSFTDTGYSDDDALRLTTLLCLLPLLALEKSDTTIDSLSQNIVSTTPEISGSSATYTYQSNGWSYTLIADYSMVTVAAKPTV